MSKDRVPLILGLIGILLIGLWYLLFSSSITSSHLPQIAQIIDFSGDVFLEHSIQPQRVKLNRSTKLYAMDTIITTEGAEALVRLDSGDEIRIHESSEIKFDQDDGKFLLIVLSGNLSQESSTNSDLVRISKDGNTWSLPTIVPTESNLQSTTGSQKQSLQSTQNTDTGLDQSSIQETLKNHQTQFYKCFTQILQKDSHAKGEVSIGFTIESSGRVSRPEIIKSSFTDLKFQKCLLDAILRAEFKSFKGKAMSMVFPLKFQ